MVTSLTGSNSYALGSELHKLVNQFLSEHGDMALERIDAEEASYDRIREALESLPFLSSKKMVVLRSPSVQKEFTENAEKLLANISETTDVIIHEPKLDKRTVYAKYLQKHTDYHDFKELDAQGLMNWLVEAANEKDATLSRSDANFLVDRLGPNQQLLATELAKLTSASKNIDRKLIEALVEPVPQSSTFDLLEAAFQGNHDRTLRLYDEQRRQNVEPQAIIGLLAWQLHVLAACAWAGEQTAQDIAKDAKLHPFVIQKSLNLAGRIGKPNMRRHIERLARLDEELKTSAVQADDAVQAYLLSLTTS